MSPIKYLSTLLKTWLMYERNSTNGNILCDFDRICYEIKPCDILLIEGRSRVSDVIRMVTQSPWTHACIYIGRLHDIANPMLRKKVLASYQCSPDEQLIIESILGQGTVVKPINVYKNEHIRICRPSSIIKDDAIAVTSFVINRLGINYDVRHIFDLLRFLLPWSIMPRRWRSSLFQRRPGTPTKQICSSMIGEAFASIDYPILPIIKKNKTKKMQILPSNHRLLTPSDFDYSPFFDIIKYPIIEIKQQVKYRELPWQHNKNEEKDLS